MATIQNDTGQGQLLGDTFVEAGGLADTEDRAPAGWSIVGDTAAAEAAHMSIFAKLDTAAAEAEAEAEAEAAANKAAAIAEAEAAVAAANQAEAEANQALADASKES